MNLYKNNSLLLDYYELTMCNGYFHSDMGKKEVVFDMFFRRNPDGGGFSIMAGLSQVLDYVLNLKFNKEDIEYLRSLNKFSEEFLAYLLDFKFKGDIISVREGTPIFPMEPILTIKGNLMETQLVETMILMIINHQSLIATKAARLVRASNGLPVFEFGSRRAHGSQGAILGARAAYIGGISGTACALSGKYFNIPVVGTMAHSWVQSYASELEAFRAFGHLYKEDITLLVDTYSVLKSGVPNAICVFKELQEQYGSQKFAIRIDSGDIAYLSQEARKILDYHGFTDVKILGSNGLDEYTITELLGQNAALDAFGVGERLITSYSDPVFGGVYKICAMKEGDEFIPKIKISENVGKITNPGIKRLYRIFDKDKHMALGDLITLDSEEIDQSKPLEIFDPNFTWKRKVFTNYYIEDIRIPVVKDGIKIYEEPTIHEIREYSKSEQARLWKEVKRFKKPHKYYVDLSKKLWTLKNELIEEKKEEIEKNDWNSK